jgi:hypothetical protein
MSENKKRLVSGKKMEQWNSLPKEVKVRHTKGSEEFREALEQLRATDSDFERKEIVIYKRAKEGEFAKHPPEEWGDMARRMYFSLVALMN